MRDSARPLSRACSRFPDIATVEQQTGRAEQGEDTWAPNRSELHVELTAPDGATEAATIEDDARRCSPATRAPVRGADVPRRPHLREHQRRDRAGRGERFRRRPRPCSTPRRAEIAAVLAARAGRGRRPRRTAPRPAPHVAIRLRPERLRSFGLPARRSLRQAPDRVPGRVGRAGTTAASAAIDVVVLSTPRAGAIRDASASCRAECRPARSHAARRARRRRGVAARDVIRHEGGRRRQTVTSNVAGRDVTSFVADARRAVAEQVSCRRHLSGLRRHRGGAGAARSATSLLRGPRRARRRAAPRDASRALAQPRASLVAQSAARARGRRARRAWSLQRPAGLSLGALVGFVDALRHHARATPS